jgi:hypothetical protein
MFLWAPESGYLRRSDPSPLWLVRLNRTAYSTAERFRPQSNRRPNIPFTIR